jgi:predicted outer membrane repeat protein
MLYNLMRQVHCSVSSLVSVTVFAALMPGGPAVSAQPAAVLYVDSAAPDGGNGQSWVTAFRHLRDALAVVQHSPPSCEIRIAQGVYRPDQGTGVQPGNLDAAFHVPAGTTLSGGYAGGNALAPDARDPDAWPTVLSGDLLATGLPPGDHTSHSHRLLVIEDVSTSLPVQLDGLTLTGAFEAALYCQHANGVSVANCRFKRNRGALWAIFSTVVVSESSIIDSARGIQSYYPERIPVIRADMSDLLLSGCVIKNNDSTTVIIDCQEGSLQMSGCTVSQNRSRSNCFITSDCEVQLRDCLFDGNQADGGSYSPGYFPRPLNGGLFRVSGGQLAVDHCRLTRNRTTGDGGGFSLDGNAAAAFSDCHFQDNTAYQGGAVYVEDSSPVFTRCRFDSNSTAPPTPWGISSAGGAVSSFGGSMTFVDSIFNGNATSCFGGALRLDDTAAILVNCVLTGNSAGSGGHAMSGYGQAVLTHCLVTGNGDPSYPSGECISWGTTSTITAYNSILWNGPLPSLPIMSASYCCIQDETPRDGLVYPGAGNIDSLPEFALADDFHLTHKSPCIDAGGDDPPGGLPATDLDGNPRILDGNGAGNPPDRQPPGKQRASGKQARAGRENFAMPDIGPYEYNPEQPGLAVSGDLELFIPQGTQPGPAPLLIRNCGGGRLRWTISGATDWLTVLPDSGSVPPPQTAEAWLTIESAQLDPGTRVCALTIDSPNAANAPRVVTVTVHITAPYHVPWTHSTIQQAIDAAPPGSTVLVADGTYSGPGNWNLDLRGKALTVLSENGPESTLLRSDGFGGSVFRFLGQPANDAVVDGFTIKYGAAPAIVCSASHPTISNCLIKPDWLDSKVTTPAIELMSSNATVLNCTLSDMPGPAIRCQGGAPVIESCEISGIITPFFGGAIRAEGSQLTLRDCQLRNNQSDIGAALCCMGGSSCTLSNCELTGNNAPASGGAVYVAGSSSISIADSTIAANRSGKGGGLYIEFGSASLSNCELKENTAPTGAAVASWSTQMVFHACRIHDNSADSLSGGAVNTSTGSLVIHDSIFAANTGGAVWSGGAAVELKRNRFEGNTANRGGALYADYSSLDVEQCEFRANFAYQAGALYSMGYQGAGLGGLALKDCLFLSNEAATEGGAAFCLGQPVSMVNCIVSGNTAKFQAGGFRLTSNLPMLVANCAFIGNRASLGAGGLFFLGTGQMQLVNSILWANSAKQGAQAAVAMQNPASRIAYCLVEGGMSGFFSRPTLPPMEGIISENPGFLRDGRWDDKGTPETTDDEWIEGDYVLTPESPCIDAGDSTVVPAETTLDLAGEPRIVDDPSRPDTGISGPAGVVDIGPYEFQPANSRPGQY